MTTGAERYHELLRAVARRTYKVRHYKELVGLNTLQQSRAALEQEKSRVEAEHPFFVTRD